MWITFKSSASWPLNRVLDVLTIPVAISVVAILISIASAIYSRQAALSSAAANKISIHSEKLDVYETFSKFRSELIAHGGNFPKEYLYACNSASKDAEFYYTKETSALFNELVEVGDVFYRARWKWERAEERSVLPENIDDLIDDAYDKLKPLHKLVEELEVRMRKELIVGDI
tara:strand:+ start:153 stop:671 length:519 start_codon:yes stop_codon:yes gene_type:complete